MVIVSARIASEAGRVIGTTPCLAAVAAEVGLPTHRWSSWKVTRSTARESSVSTASEQPVTDYPQVAAARGRVEPSPRRVRGFLGGQLVFDTTSARYVWEIPYYPQYY